MNVAVNKLANVVFKKPLQECNLEELHQLVLQYPYFGPARLLLAKKLFTIPNGQGDNPFMYDEQVQKSSLYFQNRAWLHYLLNDSGNSNTVIELATVAEKEAAVADEEQNQPGEFIENENNEAGIIHVPVKEETIDQTEVLPEIHTTETEPITKPLINENNEVQLSPEPDKTENAEQTDAPLEMPSLKIEPITANTGLVFEPYHTVDYFASQGIKFKEDEKPKDRFSVQLKSFTEWLKTMKRIPASEIPATSDAGSEKKVVQMAEYSIAERHVITEAMAEVWIKQGNKLKAEDIYRKLSLLDPSKSSYFAAKIEELKKLG